jgi:hypothetical protein
MSTTALVESRISLTIPLLASTESRNGDASRSPDCDARWNRIVADLERLRNLEPDWDGQGSLPVDSANIERADVWIREMRGWQNALPPTRVLPGTTGEIVLEWCTESLHLAAEISTPDRVEWLLNVPGQAIKQWESDSRGPWIVVADHRFDHAGRLSS